MFKRFSPTRLISIIFAVVAVALGIAAGVSSGKLFAENERYESIRINGRTATASELDYKSTNIKYDSEYMFYLTFSYMDDAGNWRDGRTSANYTEVEALDIILKKELVIKYTADGTVEADFDKEQADGLPRLLLSVLGGLAGLFIIIAAVTFFAGKKSVASIEKHGVNAEGKVVSVDGGFYIGRKELFRLKISFRNERGEKVVGTTPRELESSAAEAYKPGDKVKIRYYGKDVILREQENNQQ